MGTKTRGIILLAVAVCLGLGALASAAPPTVDLAPPTVAVQNDAGATGEALVGVVTETLTARAQAMPQLRASVAQPWALEATIESASTSKDRAQVSLSAELAAPTAGLRYLAKAECEAKSDAEAAGKACEEVMEELGLIVNAKGSVYYYGDRALEAWITIGSSQGLRPEAKVAFLVNGEKVGTGCVITVKDADSIVRVNKSVPAGNVTTGVDVRVIENGSRSAVRAVIAHEDRKSGVSAFLAFALLGGLIVAAR
jgi:hypothetical protein